MNFRKAHQSCGSPLEWVLSRTGKTPCEWWKRVLLWTKVISCASALGVVKQASRPVEEGIIFVVLTGDVH